MRLSRTAALLLTLSLLPGLSGCAKPAPAPSSSSTPEPPPAVSVLPDPEPEPEPEPVLPYVNPLTGEGTADDLTQDRPIAIMLNNLKKALPQLGVSQADLIYEAPAEGGITRMMAVFQSVEGVGEIGSVRSARDYYVSLAAGHDAVFLHAGGSPQAYSAIQKLRLAALDCVNGPYEGTLYWRDAERKKSMGLEHSVLTSGETIAKLLPTYSSLRLEHQEDFSLPLTFTEEPLKEGQAANSLSLTFSTYKTGVFTYDPALGQYRVEEYDKPYVDGNTGGQVCVKNVLVLFTDVSAVAGDTAGRLKVRTTGSGSGWLLRDGLAQEITWHKESDTAPLSFTDPDGAPVPLGVGKSYINLVDEGAAMTMT